MKCGNCGSDLKKDAKFCSNCGADVEKFKVDNEEKEEKKVDSIPAKNEPVQNSGADALSVIGLILGIICILTSWFLTVFAIPVAIIGIILSAVSRTKGGMKVAGIVLNIISIVIGLIVLLIFAMFLAVGVDTFITNPWNQINKIIDHYGEDDDYNYRKDYDYDYDYDDDDDYDEDKDDVDEDEDDDDSDEIDDILDSMSNWNRYSSLRSGNLGNNKVLTGGWRILDDDEQYWEFTSNSFRWYKSVNDLNDNYWEGSIEILKGRAGFKEVGIKESKFDDILKKGATYNDIYTVVMTPTKIISGGVDKSSTNIKDGQKFRQIWIIVDHGSQGIEGQVYDVDSNSIGYFVKIKD